MMTGTRRITDDDSLMARAERVLNRHGLATLIALGLVLWLALQLTQTVNAINAMLTGHVLESNFYLRQVCLNTANDEAQRAACISIDRSRR